MQDQADNHLPQAPTSTPGILGAPRLPAGPCRTCDHVKLSERTNNLRTVQKMDTPQEKGRLGWQTRVLSVLSTKDDVQNTVA
jgi:hypothetical protein